MTGSARIAALLAMSITLSCVAAPRVALDETADFSTYRTWDWLPEGAQTIDSEDRLVAGLNRDLVRFVGRELEARGLERVRGAADLRIAVVLHVSPEVTTVQETGAFQLLSSHHASPSYEVQSSVSRERYYEQCRLGIVVADARRGRVVWKGTLGERVEDALSPAQLRRMIATLLSYFPGPRDPAVAAVRPE